MLLAGSTRYERGEPETAHAPGGTGASRSGPDVPSTGGARGGGGGGGNPPHPHPRSTEAPGGEAGETRAALKHGPPHPRRRARLTDRPRPRRRESTPAAAHRGEGTLHPPPPGGPDGGARVGTGHRAVTPGAGGPARAHAGRAGGGPGRSPVPPPPPPTTGRQRAAAAATTDGRDPTRARARAPERETRPGEGRRSLVDTPRHRRAGGGGRHGWEAAAGLGCASTPGSGTGAADGREEGHQTAQRRGTRRRKQEKQRGGKDRGPPRGGSGTLQRCLKARGRPPGHTGSHRPRPPAQGRSHGTRGHRPGPRRALATSRGSGRNHHATVTTGPENALPHAQRRQPPPHTPCSTSDPRAASPSSRGAESTSPGDDRPPHTQSR